MVEARFTPNAVEILVHAEQLEMYSATTFKTGVLEHLAQKPQRVVLNLAEVEFLDSSAIGAIFYLKKFVQNYGGELILCQVVPHVQAIFQLTKVSGFLKITATTAEALNTAPNPNAELRGDG